MQKPNKQLRILFTDVGHPVTGGTLKSLRMENEDFYFVGVDNTRDTMGFLWVDKFYVISKPSSSKYIGDLLKVASKEKIDLIIPWTNEEALLIARHSILFKERGVKLLNNTEEKIRSVVDKGMMFENLKTRGFPIPNYKLASNLKEIKQAVISLGYPKKSVVVKPRSLSGKRGFCIIDNKPELNKRGFGNKLPLNAFLSLLEESGKTKNLDYLVMDFLGGRDFSVDCLCKDGKPLFIIPRTRINAMGGVSLIGEFTDDLEVRKQVEKVIKVANGGAGINLLYLGIKLVSGKPIPNKNNLKYHGVKMVRYWEQMYIKTNKQFNP